MRGKLYPVGSNELFGGASDVMIQVAIWFSCASEHSMQLSVKAKPPNAGIEPPPDDSDNARCSHTTLMRGTLRAVGSNDLFDDGMREARRLS